MPKQKKRKQKKKNKKQTEIQKTLSLLASEVLTLKSYLVGFSQNLPEKNTKQSDEDYEYAYQVADSLRSL